MKTGYAIYVYHYAAEVVSMKNNLNLDGVIRLPSPIDGDASYIALKQELAKKHDIRPDREIRVITLQPLN